MERVKKTLAPEGYPQLNNLGLLTKLLELVDVPDPTPPQSDSAIAIVPKHFLSSASNNYMASCPSCVH